ncbi:unnamed protein product [Vitrella brassicaformis CCMP3155]|uniref:Uncharacterized protein n=1 Tax=Vitrella brassicaformis (strain CCMP3155) TaxID=1169540 RepID=A0A0G4F6B9_VITBC|nr:unnamed protein product [Vitrella brassicaformis CCMP3155]|eukprot:CEM07805.1 unnamed protein product [Vitrella brassicaformis CCMP3155]
MAFLSLQRRAYALLFLLCVAHCHRVSVSAKAHSAFLSPPRRGLFGHGGQKERAHVKPLLQRSSLLTRLNDRLPFKVPEKQQIQFKSVPEWAISAVEKSGFRATVSDMASLGGTDLRSARTALTTLADVGQGNLEVSNEGELVYTFPRTLRATLASRSIAQQIRNLWQSAWPVIFYLIRVGFGLALVASLLLVLLTFIFLSTSTRSEDDRDREERRPSYGYSQPPMFMPSPFGFNLWYNPFDPFIYRPYGYYDVYRDPDEMGFLESVFSYVFGDGDPNYKLSEERIKAATSLIRQNGGVVTAEQLAPLLEPQRDPVLDENSASFVVDESFVLPLLSELNGEAIVTNEGDIVYSFPDVMTTAVDQDAQLRQQMSDIASLPDDALVEFCEDRGIPINDCVSWFEIDRRTLVRRAQQFLADSAEVPVYLEEQEVPFSQAPEGKKFLAGGLGIANLVGVLALGAKFNQIAQLPVRLVGLPAFVQGIFPLLTFYAISFNVVPVLRAFVVNKRNGDIAQRNEMRRKWAAALQAGAPFIRRKLDAARRMAKRVSYVQKESAIYTTERDLLDQESSSPGRSSSAADMPKAPSRQSSRTIEIDV